MKKILLFIILFSTIGFSQIVRQPMLSDSLRAAEAAVALEVADLVTVDDSLASDVVDLIAVDDSLASDISDAGTIQDSLVLDIADLVTVDDSLASDISDVITIQDSLVLDIADLVVIDDSLVSDIAEKMDENFSGLGIYSGTTGEADIIPYMAEGDGTTYKLEVNDLPISTAVTADQAEQDIDVSETYATKSALEAVSSVNSTQDEYALVSRQRLDSLAQWVYDNVNPFPSMPTNVVATTLSDTEIRCTWTNSTDTFDSTAVYYRIDGVTTTPTPVIISPDSAAYTFTGLTEATYYEMWFRHRTGDDVFSSSSAFV